jgi:hypothetical protein
MVESPKPSSIQVKDYIVVVPTLGTALAISWEVGSFLPIGGIAFGAFSLTEHLVFALQALPHFPSGLLSRLSPRRLLQCEAEVE